MFPRVASFVSGTIGYIIIGSAAIGYISQFIQQPVSGVFTVGLSAFALLAALSGLCLAFAPYMTTDEDKKAPLYAGEKFFHSCLLLLQTIFLKYVTDSVLVIQWIQDCIWLRYSVMILANFLLVVTGSLATYFCLYGFQAINDFFWKRYELRWKEMHRKK